MDCAEASNRYSAAVFLYDYYIWYICIYILLYNNKINQRVGGRGCYCIEPWVWTWGKHHLVQILVVVASIQMRTLKAEEEKGSMWTAIGHGLAGPKEEGNSLRIFGLSGQRLPKGKGVTILLPKMGNRWQHKLTQIHWSKPPGAFSFLLNWYQTCVILEADYPEIGLHIR